MPRSYQQFVAQLSTDELLVVQRQKLGEIARKQTTRSEAWCAARHNELGLIRAQIRLRGEQLSIDELLEDERANR